MAFIYIRKRREPIEVENERARKIKLLRFGNQDGEGKADPSDLIDLGDDWAGEIGQISSVEITKTRPQEVKVDPLKEQNEWRAAQLAMPVEVRAKNLTVFKIAWFMRSGMKQKEPPPTVMEFAERMALNWFKAHPNAPELGGDVLEELLTKHWGAKKGKGLLDKRLSTGTEKHD